MRKSAFIFLFSLFAFHLVRAQAPLVKAWDKRYGGLKDEKIYCFEKTRDGGFIVAIRSDSPAGGDKTENEIGLEDYWVLKIDSLGSQQWENTLGGTGGEVPWCITQTRDGGYIVGGTSSSGVSVDKSEPLFGVNQDCWVVKLDTKGNKVWDKDFGGINSDRILTLLEIRDGYLLGCTSSSGANGNKSFATKGLDDFWLIKIDTAGNKKWDYDYGAINQEELRVICPDHEGGYMLFGNSSSFQVDDKTHPSRGGMDFWIVKIDSFGNKLRDWTIGGPLTDQLLVAVPTPDGGYLLGGVSVSGIGSEKTEDTKGLQDLWMVKIDSACNKLWDKDYGGSGYDMLGNLTLLKDGNYLVSAISESPADGDKTETNAGSSQNWIIKTDTAGVIIWDKTVLIPGRINGGSLAQEARDSGIVVASFTTSDSGLFKSQANWDRTLSYNDLWVIKLWDTTFHKIYTETKHLPATAELSFTLYPNPTTGLLTVSSEQVVPGNVSITDVLGRELMTRAAHNAKLITLNVCGLPTGVYFVTLQTLGQSFTQKFIKQ